MVVWVGLSLVVEVVEVAKLPPEPMDLVVDRSGGRDEDAEAETFKSSIVASVVVLMPPGRTWNISGRGGKLCLVVVAAGELVVVLNSSAGVARTDKLKLVSFSISIGFGVAGSGDVRRWTTGMEGVDDGVEDPVDRGVVA